MLGFESMDRFNVLFMANWEAFLENSPWKEDPFLVARLPVGICVQYGQNLPVCPRNADALRMEVDQFSDSRRWKRFRFVSMALATHIR